MDRKLALTIQFLAADKLSGSLRSIVGLGESGAQKLAKMRREAKDLNKQLSSASGNVTELINRERDLANAIEKQKRLMQIDNRVGKVQAQADAYKSAGMNNMMGGVALAAPLVLAGREAMMFSSGMVDLQQKADLTNAEMVKMRGNILAAAKATHQLPEDMRAAVDVLAGFGMDPRQAVQLSGPIGRLGTAFKVELADGAAAAYANINNLKVPLAQTGKAFDIMAAGGNAGAFEIKDMAKWFPKLTSQAQALGQKGVAGVADLTAALQIARRGAGSADEAANNVSNLLAKINAPGTIRAFQKNFGVDLPAALEAAYRKGKSPMEAIAEITKKATGGDLKRLGFAFEDMQAQSAIRSLILDLDDFKKMREEISGASGTVDVAFDQREVGDGMVAWNSFKVMLSATALEFGTKLLPIATQFLGILGPMVGAIGDFAQANPQVTSTLLTLVAGIAGAKIGLGALQFAFGSILGPAAQAWGMFQKLRAIGAFASIASKTAGAFNLIRMASMFMAKGVMRAGMLMMANPMVLAIVAIVAVIGVAGYLIYKHWNTIKGAFNAGLGMLTAAGQWIKQKFMEFPALFGPLGVVVHWVITHWDQIKAAFFAGVAMIGTAWQWIKDSFNQAVTWLTGLGSRMLSIGKAIIQGLANGIMAAPGAVWNALKSVVTGGIDRVKSMLGIKSPSRVFMEMGGFVTEGLALGVERTERRPVRAVGKLATATAAAGAMAAQPLAAQPAAQVQGATYNITIQQQPGEDGEQLARRVVELLKRQDGNMRRGAYRDA